MLNSPTYFASGNIYPSRFVFASNQFRVQQTGANGKIVGISQSGTRRFPDQDNTNTPYAAITGEPIAVFGEGYSNVFLTLGGSVTAGAYLKADADGKGVTSTGAAADNVGAIAQQDGVSGDKILVQVILQPARP
jgi:hypothetical protein